MSRALRRRALASLALVPLSGALSGCLGLGAAPARIYYELDDLGHTPAAGGAPIEHSLLVAGVAIGSLLDGTGLVFSRAAGAREYYQFASWAERPAARIARLLARRLRQARVFRDVAMETAPVRGDWLLEVQLEHLFHDDVSPPGEARIELALDLIDRASHRSLARQRFAQREPLAVESASQAVAAFDRALTRLLDDAANWVIARAAHPTD